MDSEITCFLVWYYMASVQVRTFRKNKTFITRISIDFGLSVRSNTREEMHIKERKEDCERAIYILSVYLRNSFIMIHA